MSLGKESVKETNSDWLICNIKRRQVGIWEDFFLCTAMLLVCAFYQMDNYRLNVSNIKTMPDLSTIPSLLQPIINLMLTYGMNLVRVAFAALFIITLIIISFSNGVLKRWRFISTLSLLFVLPQLGLLLINTSEHNGGIFNFLSDLSVVLGQWPFVTMQKVITRMIPISLPLVAVFVLVLTVIMFFQGYIYNIKFGK